MKTFHRLLLAGLAVLAVVSVGCVITSAQIFAHYDLPDPFVIDSVTDPFEKIDVDLSNIKDYQDNKNKLQGLADIAFGGRFINQSGPAGSIEVWMTRGVTNYASVGQVTANGIKLWGPAGIGASGTPGGTVKLTWAQSSALFNAAGRQALIDEAKGDGTFTIYTFGTTGLYRIRVEGGTLLLTFDIHR